MSTLKADTIQNTSGGAATLTKQVAAKHLAYYDATDQTVDFGFNSSSVTDSSTGKFEFNFTNSFNSSSDKVPQFNCWPTQDAGANRYISSTRGMSTEENGAVAHSSSKVAAEYRYGASNNSASVVNDLDGHYVTVFGDLA